jgi:PKD repeat protein
VARAGSNSLSLSDAKLLVNPQGNLTLLWQQTVDNGPANLFAMLYDPITQTWSADRRLNVDSAMTHDVNGYYGRDNQLHATYLSTQIARSSETIIVEGEPRLIENIPQSGQVDLHVLDHSLVIDLAVTDKDLSITPASPREGDTVTATVTVHNAGDFPVSNFMVYLYVGGPDAGGVLVGTASVLDILRAGDQKDLTFIFTYPSGGGNVVAVVDAVNNVTELTKANNRATSYANNSAPQASITANIVSGRAPLVINFDSVGSLDSEGDAMTFSWAFADGSASAQGTQVTHTFAQAGTFPVTLVVTDSRGAVGTAVVFITVMPDLALRVDTVIPLAGRSTGGQQIGLAGSFPDLSTVTVGGIAAAWSYTNGTSEIMLTTPPHLVGAVQIDLAQTSGGTLSKSNAFAYLPSVFMDDKLEVGVTTAKVQHIIELRQAVDALRVVAGLGPAPWTDPVLERFSTPLIATHIKELRKYLDEAAVRLGYPTQPYTDPLLAKGFVIQRVYIEELRQRIRAIAG